jgi:hypothetical protein
MTCMTAKGPQDTGNCVLECKIRSPPSQKVVVRVGM